MNARFASSLIMLCLLSCMTGCLLPRTKVIKNPGEKFDGVRYYRPKPYLLVKQAVGADVDPNTVDLSIEYLPDFSEEYGIKIRSGLGTNDTNITLENGWNLIGLNVKVDSQFDENLKAVGEVVGAVGGLPIRGNAARLTVCATNVPLGLYESIIGRDACGKKQFYGWRYIGFAPFHSCPVVAKGGPECVRCDDDSLDLWGLVWEGGMMKFKRIGDIAAACPKACEQNEDHDREGTPPSVPQPETAPVSDEPEEITPRLPIPASRRFNAPLTR